MANKALHAAEEELELNLTPMIDVCFNLIIFFMIITDMTQKDLEQLKLPKATQDVEDQGEESDRVVVNIAKTPVNGSVANWRPGNDVTIKVKSKAYDLPGLQSLLKVYAERKRDMSHPMTPSEVFVLIRCDKEIRWREVQWVMQAAADPDVRIYKIQFATAKNDNK